MPTLSFSFETGAIPTSRIIDAFAVNYNYQATIPDPENPGQTITNPETKALFAKRMLRNHIVDIVKSNEVAVAVKTAQESITSIELT